MVPGPNILQLLGHNVQMFILSSSVCPRKASEHSLMFAVKARSIPQSGAPQRCFIQVEFGISHKHLKGFPGTNTLAYYHNL
jgi:hypothetical protein